MGSEVFTRGKVEKAVGVDENGKGRYREGGGEKGKLETSRGSEKVEGRERWLRRE